jgi:hypothetical protein
VRSGVAADALYERLAQIARSAERRGASTGGLGERIALDAVFLVQEDSVKQLKSEVRATAALLVDEGADVGLSGPWPPYSFVGAP